MRFPLFLLVATVFSFGSAQGIVIINVSQVNGDTVFSGSGSLDLTGTTPPISGVLGAPGIVEPNLGNFGADAVGSPSTLDVYSATSNAPTGSGGLTTTNNVTGDAFGLTSSGVAVIQGYSSNDAIVFTATFSGSTIEDLGITPGVYTWNLPSDSVTLNVPAVPEPSMYAALVGIAIFGFTVKRRISTIRK
ncbi:MAG: PEP-CTERM sorting domain-containing protein [Verrucomicrobiota bacterium]